ncbi:MAG: Hpt domain-containing protein [Sterolibacterium sp.]
MTDLEELQAKLKVLSDAYAAQLPEKIRQIEQIWSDLPHDSFNEAGFATLHRMVHSLTGSGKTFGFSLLSDVARSLEEYILDLAQAKTIPNEEQCEHIRLLLQKLLAAAVHSEVGN